MKAIALIAFSLVLASIPALAGTITYSFDFAVGGTISYVTTSPTAPGTDLTSLFVHFSPPSHFDRDSSGAWYFDLWYSPTATTVLTAETDLGFANSPGFYPGLPATYNFQNIIGGTSGSTTVDISIQETPEPATILLLLSGLALVGGLAPSGGLARRT